MNPLSSELPFCVHNWLIISLKNFCIVIRKWPTFLPSKRNVDYSQHLKILKLPSMQYRLRRGDMIQVYKIVKGLDRVPSEMFFKFCDASDDMRQTRGHNWKIFKPQHTLDVRKHTFSMRIINDWNSLSAEVVNAESLNIYLYIQKQIGQVVGPG